jgi:hypothetical protein
MAVSPAFAGAGSPCGGGTVEEGEACDDGDSNSDAAGVWCTAGCEITPCGAPQSRKQKPVASDALFTLRASIGTATCDLRVCDTNGNGSITASDALQVLRKAVGLAVTLSCPATLGGPTCVGRSFDSIGEVFAALAGKYVVQLDGGAGGIYDFYAAGSLLELQVIENFLGYPAALTLRDHAGSYGSQWFDGSAGYSWEDLDHEVNVFFGADSGTTKILQCDKTTGELTFVVAVASGGPNFARLVTTP